MKLVTKLYNLAQITFGDNPRIPNRMAITSLRESIEALGLQTLIMVVDAGNGTVQVVRGHRRATAMQEMFELNPTRFNELFGKGIPCQLVSDVSPEEVVDLKLDHAEVKSLTDPHEVQRSANMLFACGKTEADVAVQLAPLIDLIAPMRPANKLELEALKVKTAKAIEGGNKAEAELARRAEKDYTFNYRRGFVQNLHSIFRCPDVVMAALYFKACGEKPARFKDEVLPVVTTAQAVALYKLHFEDCKEIDAATGMSKYNKAIVGPKFSEKWAELCAKSQAVDGKGEGEPKLKAMASKEMEAEKTQLKSLLAVRLTRKHMGEKGITDIAVLDDHAYRADLVRNHDAAAWAEFVNKANKIEEGLIAAAKAAAPVAPAAKS